jgi:hypothetical protein
MSKVTVPEGFANKIRAVPKEFIPRINQLVAEYARWNQEIEDAESSSS